jgi:hypothetical protein
MFPKWADFDITYTKRGKLLQTVRKSLTYATIAAVLIGGYQLRKQGGDLRSAPHLLKVYLKLGVLKATELLNFGLRKVHERVASL